MFKRQQDPRAMHFVTDRNFQQLGKRLPHRRLLFRLHDEQQKTAIAGAADFSAFRKGVSPNN